LSLDRSPLNIYRFTRCFAKLIIWSGVTYLFPIAPQDYDPGNRSDPTHFCILAFGFSSLAEALENNLQSVGKSIQSREAKRPEIASVVNIHSDIITLGITDISMLSLRQIELKTGRCCQILFRCIHS